MTFATFYSIGFYITFILCYVITRYGLDIEIEPKPRITSKRSDVKLKHIFWIFVLSILSWAFLAVYLIGVFIMLLIISLIHIPPSKPYKKAVDLWDKFWNIKLIKE